MKLLDLADPLWQSLRGTHSNGSFVAAQLAALQAGTLTNEDQENFWQELCHQDDSTEAGYAAVPHLIAIADESDPKRALFLLTMAAHVFACSKLGSSHRVPENLRASLDEAGRRALQSIGRLLVDGQLPDSDADVKALVGAIAALFKKLPLYVSIERLDESVTCPRCELSFLPEEAAQAIKAKSIGGASPT